MWFKVENANATELIEAMNNEEAVRIFIDRHPEELHNALTVKPFTQPSVE